MQRKLRVYLAGPDVFLPNAVEIGSTKKQICARHGFVGQFPLDNELDSREASPQDQGLAISRANEGLMRKCDLVIANMTPFRGPSMDVGTAYEMGVMRALGKPVLGYRNTSRAFFERVFAAFGEPSPTGASGHLIGPDGMAVENFELGDNLMLDGAVIDSGFTVVERDVPDNEVFTSMEAFEECVQQAAKELL